MMLTNPRALPIAFLLALTTTPAAASALLIEGALDGKALRILVDTATSQADVTLGEARHRVDLEADEAQLVETDGTLGEHETLEASDRGPKPEIEAWGPGPMIAGHASVYHVMTLDETICGELLISPWMKPFVSPAIEALAILERIKGEHDIKAATLDGPCGKLPFSSYAAAGWPLMAGGLNQPVVTTETISFDYDPTERDLTWMK